MALINCPECGKEISDRVVSCPNCGCPASDWYAFSITSSVRKCNNVKKMCVCIVHTAVKALIVLP